MARKIHQRPPGVPVLVQNENNSVLRFMSSTRRQGSPTDRVRDQTERRALKEATRVPWRILSKAAEEYTDWQTFALWLRAVLDSCEALPADLVRTIEKRSPSLLPQIRAPLRGKASAYGFRVWQKAGHWAEANVFADAKRDEWLNAVRYFSSKSLPYMKAWSYWEAVSQRWRCGRPQILPDFDQWQHAVCSVTRLSDPESDVQQVLNSVRSVPGARWQKLLGDFLELTALGLWIEILLKTGRPAEDLVTRELTLRYPGFTSGSIKDSNTVVSTLIKWVISHEAAFADVEPAYMALSYHTKYHPAYCARRNFASHCRELWRDGHFAPPSFAEWMSASDSYSESKIRR